MAPPAPHAAAKVAAAEVTNVVARGELRCETPLDDPLSASSSSRPVEAGYTAQFALPPDEVAMANARVPLKALLARRVGVLPLRTWLLAVFAFVFVAVLAVARDQLPTQAQRVKVRRVPVTPTAPATLPTHDEDARLGTSPAKAAEALFAGDLQRAKEHYLRLASTDQRFEVFARIVDRKLRSGCEGSAPCLSVVRGSPQ